MRGRWTLTVLLRTLHVMSAERGDYEHALRKFGIGGIHRFDFSFFSYFLFFLFSWERINRGGIDRSDGTMIELPEYS